MKLRLLGVNVLKRWDADGKLPVAASSATALDPTCLTRLMPTPLRLSFRELQRD